MAQCAFREYIVCFEANGSLFIPVSDFYQNISGNITLNTFGAGGSTPGQSYQMFAGTINVQSGGVQIDFDGGLTNPGTLNPHTVNICATDSDGQTCCQVTLQFSDDPNCNNSTFTCNNLTVNDGDTITPGMVASGATSFGSPVVAGVNGTSFSGDTSTSVTAACTGASNGTINLRLSDNTVCTVNVNCGAVGGNCNSLTVNDGDAISPGMLVSGATAFADPAVTGRVGVDFTVDVNGNIVVDCEGSADGTIDIMVAGQTTACPVNVNCDGTTGSLTCASPASFTVLDGQIIPTTSIVSGGSAPYNVTGATSPLQVSSNSARVISGTAPGSYAANVSITDSAGNSTTCTVTLNVEDTATCINTIDSSVTAPATATAGQTITITANINPSSGGLAGHYLQIVGPNGNVVATPTFVSGNNWSVTLPAAVACTNGAHSVVVQPPVGSATVCQQWNASTITLSGCNTTGTCTTTVNGATITGCTDPGCVRTITIPADQCTCAGYTLVTEMTQQGSVPATINTPNSRTVTFQIPPNASSGDVYVALPKCCPPGAA